MKRFKFTLQRVLEWRALQLRSEEEKLTELQHQLTLLARAHQELEAARGRCEAEVTGAVAVAGSELQALAAFQVRVVRQQELLRERRVQVDAMIVAQRERLLKARKDHRVIENLKDRRLKAWTYDNDREEESTANEVYLSKWVREEAERLG